MEIQALVAPSMGYEETLAYLYGLQRFGIKLGLGNVRRLLTRLGDPQEAFASVHVAGSSGKGSVCALLDAVLRRAGHRVGLFTSPHLVRFNERIRVDGEEIPDADVVRLTEALRPHAEALRDQDPASQPTFFEFTTALAFRHFQEQAVDLAVLEVGMGGRLDATNVVRPEVAVITRIEKEHTRYLGRTVPRIAREKAGILKGEVPAWTVEQPALAVIEARCEEVGAPLRVVGRDLHVERLGGDLSGQDIRLTFDGGASRTYRLGLLGTYQAENAALARGALQTLREEGWGVPETAVRQGLRAARWPARLEIVSPFPPVILDVTHTPEGAARTAESLRELFPETGFVVVVGVLEDKDLEGIVQPLLPLMRELILTAPESDKALPAEAAAARLAGLAKGKVVAPVAKAFQAAVEEAGPRDAILITGSLYTGGEALVSLERWRRDRALEVIRRLKEQYLPGEFASADLETALGRITQRTEDPFIVLVSTVLSQRTADPTTEAVSAGLFARYPTAAELAAAPLEEIEELVRPANFYRTKAKAIREIAARVAGEHNGQVPEDFDALCRLPLVGRKTANCVLVYGYGKPAIPVDVHCHRIPNRIGLVRTAREEETEEALMGLLPQDLWMEVNELFVRHGQATCKPRLPDCPACALQDLCGYYQTRARQGEGP